MLMYLKANSLVIAHGLSVSGAVELQNSGIRRHSGLPIGGIKSVLPKKLAEV
jgi:hypothetical protein